MTEAATTRSKRAATALAHLPEHDPALSALALWCDMQDAPGNETFTSDDSIHIGADFVRLPLREQIGVLGHHVLHIALRHEFRMGAMQQRFGAAFDAATHNLCSDAIINECLERGGHSLPRPAVLLKRFLEDADAGGLDPAQDVLSQWDVDRLYMQIQQRGIQNVLADYQETTGFKPDIHPNEIPLKTDRDAGIWRAHLVRAARSSGAAGRGIGQLLHHLSDATASRTPWEHHLRRVLAKATSHDPKRSYRRPRSAWIAADAHAQHTGGPQPVFEPAIVRYGIRPRLVVAVDASGSVDLDVLALFAGEVVGITNKSNAETHILCFDEEVFAHRCVTGVNARSAFQGLPLRRDGGTSFIDVLSQAEALKPSMIIVLTDLMGAFGPRPSAPVLWATPIPPRVSPPFGTVLELVR
ncbi:MAG: VWA-like domain-containing protein [Roseobacter sp.]